MLCLNQLREISAAIGHKRALSSSNHNSPLVKERRSLIWHVLTRQCTAKVGFTFKKNLFPFPPYLRLIFLLSWMLGKNHDRELEWESPGNVFISHFIFHFWFIKDFWLLNFKRNSADPIIGFFCTHINGNILLWNSV